MNVLHDVLPLLTRHSGVWEGEYHHVGPDFALQDRHAFRIKVEFPVHGPVHYRQTSHYWWHDGRTEQRCFDAAWDAGSARLAWDDGRIRGAMWQVDEVTLYLRFAFLAEPHSYVCEMIQLAADGVHRARTWHWFREGRPWRLTLVRERRVSADPDEFERRHGAPSLEATT